VCENHQKENKNGNETEHEKKGQTKSILSFTEFSFLSLKRQENHDKKVFFVLKKNEVFSTSPSHIFLNLSPLCSIFSHAPPVL